MHGVVHGCRFGSSSNKVQPALRGAAELGAAAGSDLDEPSTHVITSTSGKPPKGPTSGNRPSSSSSSGQAAWPNSQAAEDAVPQDSGAHAERDDGHGHRHLHAGMHGEGRGSGGSQRARGSGGSGGSHRMLGDPAYQIPEGGEGEVEEVEGGAMRLPHAPHAAQVRGGPGR